MKSNILEQELSNKFQAYFAEALLLLNGDLIAGSAVSDDFEYELKFEEYADKGKPTKCSWGLVQKKNFSSFVYKRWERLKILGTYEDCIKYLNDKQYCINSVEEQGLKIMVSFSQHNAF